VKHNVKLNKNKHSDRYSGTPAILDYCSGSQPVHRGTLGAYRNHYLQFIVVKIRQKIVLCIQLLSTF